MRKRIWIPCIVLLAICLLLLLRHSTKHEIDTSSFTGVILTNQKAVKLANQAIQSEASHNPQSPRASNAVTIPPRPSGIERSNEIYQQMTAEWQAHIEFYGKVVDENTNPVAGASVQ